MFFATYRYFNKTTTKSSTAPEASADATAAAATLRPAQSLLARLTSQYPLILPRGTSPEVQAMESNIQLK
jgi:hypothetical protein